MSSEDECQFLDFSNVAAELSQVIKPKMGHIRRKSQHLIEPIVLKSNAPDTHFSRPPLNKNRMFSSPSPTNKNISDNMIYQDKKVVHETSSSNSHQKQDTYPFPKVDEN